MCVTNASSDLHSAVYEGVPIVRVQPTPTSVTEGDMLELHCQITGHPQPFFRWYKMGGTLTERHEVCYRGNIYNIYWDCYQAFKRPEHPTHLCRVAYQTEAAREPTHSHTGLMEGVP